MNTFTHDSPSIFPVNITLADARKSIGGRIDFRETVEHDYVSFIYFLGMAPDIFPDPEQAPDEETKRLWQIRRECRGIIFHKETGEVLSRRFQKFFNIGELPETNINNLVVRQPFIVLEKLDGSMIAPFFVNGILRWCTKSGYTDTSQIVEKFVSRSSFPYTEFCSEWIRNGYSPIFEWCSPTGRIVLEYKEESLSLLAMRHIITGNYIHFDQLVQVAQTHNIPTVKKWNLEEFGVDSSVSELSGDQLVEFHKQIQSKIGVEGFVLQLPNGIMYKIKTNWYFSFHRSTQFLKYYGERHVWESILKGTYDDVKSWLPDPVRKAIDQFTTELMKRSETCANHLFKLTKEGHKDYPQRADFNSNVVDKLTSAEKPLVWKIRNALIEDAASVTPALVFEYVLEALLANVSSSKSLKKNQGLLGDLSYENYRPKNETPHIFATGEE